MRFFICIILCFSILCFPVSAAGSVTVSSEYISDDMYDPLPVSNSSTVPIGQVLDIKATSAVLLEPNTGKLLYESNSDERLAPASITKIMSLLLMVEAIESGRLSLSEIVVASDYACSMGGSQIWLEPGETMTVDELLKACFIASANDATVALAETVAGSEEAFVALMNARAAELGMANTNFINTTGLDAEGHYTTAYDVALMAAELISHEMVKSYSTVWMDTLRDGKSELVNTNKLVRFYEGCTGLKTGTTSKAGHCLAATAERNGLSLVAVVMKADSSNDRFEGARKMLNYGFANYSFSHIEYDNALPLEIGVTGGIYNSVSLYPEAGLDLLLKKGEEGSITQAVTLAEKVAAPVKKGDVIGTVTVYNGDTAVGVINLLAESDVPKLSFFYLIKCLLYELFIM